MDNTLNLKFKKFEDAVTTMERALNQKENEFIQDSVIKRFEYCFESCWKVAKIFLSEKFGVDSYSPKECFRELRKNQLISEESTELLLKMTDDRNEVIHTYSQNFADELYKKIRKNYFEVIKKVLEAIRNN